ncbi:MAG TPA: DUF1684 domain-containing protein [Rhizomicrobium sp.]|jgi:hypothetical protein
MRAAVLISAIAAALLLGAAAPPQTPEEAWKAGIADANVAWAKRPHAILKIQDSAYLHDGDTAVLQGTPGQPGSYHWNHDPKASGVLTVALQGGKISAMKDGKSIDTATLMKSVPIDKDVDVDGQPTQVDAGVMGWRIFVFNQQNPDALNFKGVSYFPYDPAYRVTASFKPNPKRPPHVFRTSRGTDKQFYLVGEATFSLQGKTIVLPFYSGDNDPKKIADMSAFFTDDLTGKEAYGAGRYVDIDSFGAYPPKTVTIDFNDAYNPNCARSKHFTCPVAIDNIQLAMKAGEKNPHIAH